MSEPATLQHILARFLDTEHLDSHRRRVCGHLQACRTEAMGGVRLKCERCDTEQDGYFVVVIATALNARGAPRERGLPISANTFSRCATTTWSLPCRTR